MITEDDVKKKVPDNFLVKVKFDAVDKCWIWLGTPDENGYGCFTQRGFRQTGAHRVMYRIMFDDFKNELDVCHSCDNPSCVNPNHLWQGTHADNNHDRDRKGRQVPMKGSKNGRAILSEDDVVEIKRRLRNREYQRDIAKDFGVSQTLIGHINTGRMWKHVSGSGNNDSKANIVHHFGSKHGQAKLTEKKVALIKLRLAENESQRIIATDFGVAQTAISSIKRGATWKHVQI